MWRKGLILFLILFIFSIKIASAQSTLFDYFLNRIGYFPSVIERKEKYQRIFPDEIYRGTKEQNEKYLKVLKEPVFGSVAPSAGPTAEATTTAGWTDDGSIVRLNTAADSVGIGTINPLEKLSVVGGNQYLSGTLSVSGTTFNFGTGSATSTLSTTGGLLGIGSTTPREDLSLTGDFLASGTTTTNGLRSTSAANIQGNIIVSGRTSFNGISYEWPSSDGTNRQFLQTDGSRSLSWVTGAAATTSIALIPQAVGAMGSAAGFSSDAINNDTTMNCGLYTLPTDFSVGKISINVPAWTAAGTLDIGIYDQGGNGKYREVTTASIGATGVVSTSVSPALSLNSGNYYICLVSNTSTITLDIGMWRHDSATAAALGQLSGEPATHGTATVSAGTLPATFNPNTLDDTGCSTADICAPVFRLDN